MRLCTFKDDLIKIVTKTKIEDYQLYMFNLPGEETYYTLIKCTQ